METLRDMKERFGNEKKEDIESAAAFVLYKDGKLNESLQLYKRIITRGKNANLNEAKTLCAHVLLELNKPEEAIEIVSTGIVVLVEKEICARTCACFSFLKVFTLLF